MSTDAPGEQVADVVARLRDQLADMAVVRDKQAALRVEAQSAGGTVSVTVDARGQVVKTVIEKSFLDDHDFDELGNCVTQAAQSAAREVGERVTALWAPIRERQQSFPSFSDIVDRLPDISDVLPPGMEVFGASAPRREVPSAGAAYDEGDGGSEFPTVRR